MAFRLSRRGLAAKRSEAQRSMPKIAEPPERERRKKRKEREKQNTCLYVCSIYPPFPIIVSIWETARKIMKQSFVNINSFTSQKKIVIFCFCFTKLEKKTNRQRKVFKSLVICNYASKKLQQIIQIQSNRTNRTQQTRAFFVSVWRLSPVFSWEHVRKIRATAAAAAVRHLWVFRFRVIGRRAAREKSST